MTLAALARALRDGELSPREAVSDTLSTVGRLDGALNAFLSTRPEAALAEAEALERSAERGPLWGVPIAVKDVIDVAGERTTAASRVLADHVADADAVVVERLRAAGAVVVGKLNTHEFAFGAMTTSRHFGPARNPWDTERICGGSSGGSGAAVAAGLVTAALGTDTAGSVRIPACLCGITGVRPTTGLVPNRGVVPVSFTLDTIGPLARTAEDCALLLGAIAGDRYDLAARPLRIGVVEELFERSDPQVAASVRAAVDELAGLGARVEAAELPLIDEAGVIAQLILLPEAAEWHLPYLRTQLADYGPDVRARLLAGLLLPSTALATGRRGRRLYVDAVLPLYERFDVLAAPEMPMVAPPLSSDAVAYRRALIPFNSPATLAGLPVVSTPCAPVDGLPVGLALTGPPGGEAAVLAAAHALQQATAWHEALPPVAV